MKTFRIWWDFTDVRKDVHPGTIDIKAADEAEAIKKFKKQKGAYYPRGMGYEIAGVEEVQDEEKNN